MKKFTTNDENKLYNSSTRADRSANSGYMLAQLAKSNIQLLFGARTQYTFKNEKTGELDLAAGRRFAKEYLKALDKDNDGYLSKSDFSSRCFAEEGKNLEEKIFDVLDLNSSGKINADEVLLYFIFQDLCGNMIGMVTSLEKRKADAIIVQDPNYAKSILKRLYDNFNPVEREI